MILNTKDTFSKFSASVDNSSVSQLHANVCSLTCSGVIPFGLYAISVLVYKTRLKQLLNLYSYSKNIPMRLKFVWNSMISDGLVFWATSYRDNEVMVFSLKFLNWMCQHA